MNTTGKLQILTSDRDLSEVIQLDLDQFPRPWTPKNWKEMNWNHHCLFSWELDSRIIGFALFSHVPEDDTTHLLKICLDTSIRGSGLAPVFWTACLLELKKLNVSSIYLEVEAPNQRAISFYLKSGFVTLRKIKGYYSDGIDAVTMQMTI